MVFWERHSPSEDGSFRAYDVSNCRLDHSLILAHLVLFQCKRLQSKEHAFLQHSEACGHPFELSGKQQLHQVWLITVMPQASASDALQT